MKKIMLPLIAAGIAISTAAQASNTTFFTVVNTTIKPILVFQGECSSSCSNEPVFVPAGGFKSIAVENYSINPGVCWTDNSQKKAAYPVCDDEFPTISTCKDGDPQSPNNVLVFGSPFFQNAPGLACTTVTATATATATKNSH